MQIAVGNYTSTYVNFTEVSIIVDNYNIYVRMFRSIHAPNFQE